MHLFSCWRIGILGPVNYPINVGTGLDVSIRELAESVAQATGFKGTINWDSSKPNGTPKKQLDVSRLSNLGWKAQMPLESGLLNTIASFSSELRK